MKTIVQGYSIERNYVDSDNKRYWAINAFIIKKTMFSTKHSKTFIRNNEGELLIADTKELCIEKLNKYCPDGKILFIEDIDNFTSSFLKGKIKLLMDSIKITGSKKWWLYNIPLFKNNTIVDDDRVFININQLDENSNIKGFHKDTFILLAYDTYTRLYNSGEISEELYKTIKNNLEEVIILISKSEENNI